MIGTALPLRPPRALQTLALHLRPAPLQRLFRRSRSLLRHLLLPDWHVRAR